MLIFCSNGARSCYRCWKRKQGCIRDATRKSGEIPNDADEEEDEEEVEEPPKKRAKLTIGVPQEQALSEQLIHILTGVNNGLAGIQEAIAEGFETVAVTLEDRLGTLAGVVKQSLENLGGDMENLAEDLRAIRGMKLRNYRWVRGVGKVDKESQTSEEEELAKELVEVPTGVPVEVPRESSEEGVVEGNPVVPQVVAPTGDVAVSPANSGSDSDSDADTVVLGTQRVAGEASGSSEEV